MLAPVPPSAPSDPLSPAAAPATCPNCLAEAPSRFCPECGQRQGELQLSTSALLHESLEELFNLEKKLPRTLKVLCRPGFLTTEYFAGRRERYVRPFRLFFVLSCVLFLMFGLLPTQPRVTSGSKDKAPDPLVQLLSKYRGFFGDHLDRFSAGGPAAEAARVRAVFFEAAPKANVVMLPVFALFLALLFRGAQRTFADHFVFGLHYHAFYFLVQCATVIVGRLAPSTWAWMALAVPLGIWLYLAFALRRVYGNGWAKTVLKEVALIVLYGLLQYAFSVGVVVVAVLRS